MDHTAETEVVREIYELGYHLVPTLADTEVGERVSMLKSLIAEKGGAVIADEFPRLVGLSYGIAKLVAGKKAWHHRAHFGWIKFEMAPENVESFSRDVEALREILRDIVVKTVRENTMIPKRLMLEERRSDDVLKKKEEAPKKASEGAPMTEEELDRTIEKLVVE